MDEIKETTAEPQIEEKDELTQKIEETASKIRNDAMVYGARIICSGCIQIMDKHLHKNSKVSMRDYERCFKELYNFVSVPLKKAEEETRQNDSVEEKANDGTAAESSRPNS